MSSSSACHGSTNSLHRVATYWQLPPHLFRSLGGGVATLMAFAVQRHINARMPLVAPVVSAALFAPPNVGPPQFVGLYNRLVNGRRIAFQYDIVPQVNHGAELQIARAVAAAICTADAHFDTTAGS